MSVRGAASRRIERVRCGGQTKPFDAAMLQCYSVSVRCVGGWTACEYALNKQSGHTIMSDLHPAGLVLVTATSVFEVHGSTAGPIALA